MSALYRGYRMLAVHHEKVLVSAFFGCLLISYLSTLSPETYSIVFEKSGKSLEFGSKNLYEPCKGVHCSDLTSLQQGSLVLIFLCGFVIRWAKYQLCPTSLLPQAPLIHQESLIQSAAQLLQSMFLGR